MIWIAIISLVVAAITLVMATRNKTGDRIDYFFLGLTFSFSLMIAIIVFVEFLLPSITPMDVYRGKTTLEITYRDSVAVDSVVVWKEEQP